MKEWDGMAGSGRQEKTRVSQRDKICTFVCAVCVNTISLTVYFYFVRLCG